ncbi:DUF397 domain-containing protein [Streptomyces sp. CC219B]|uniref:DUF397 domain-containing protein n=1 Tax=Streptomyces sp. CC219B TaxID=3044574 RepID=UPI0024A9A6B0|nr:DUF397 domain-containing protein [Streptomyces sp. CC219B]
MASSEHTVSNASRLTGWYKSSYSGGGQSDCLELARSSCARIPIRDSKTPTGPALTFSPRGWTSFVAALKEGDLTG